LILDNKVTLEKPDKKELKMALGAMGVFHPLHHSTYSLMPVLQGSRWEDRVLNGEKKKLSSSLRQLGWNL
jgi:hypothetical protein